MVKQYQVVVDPVALRAQNLPLSAVREAIMHANEETVGSVLEMAEAEYMVRPDGYIRSIADLEEVPLKLGANALCTALIALWSRSAPAALSCAEYGSSCGNEKSASLRDLVMPRIR